MSPTRNNKKGKQLRQYRSVYRTSPSFNPRKPYRITRNGRYSDLLYPPGLPIQKESDPYWASSKSLQLRDSSGFTPDSHLMPNEVGNLF